MSRRLELLSTVGAGAAGAVVAALVVGASLVLVVPATIGVGAIAVIATLRTSRRIDAGPERVEANP